MKKIDIDDELYQYIASNTQSIGESASTILRRLLNLSDGTLAPVETATSKTEQESPVVEPEQAIEQEPAPKHDEPEQVETVTTAQQVKGNVFNVLNKEELAMQKGVVGRFLFILAALYRTHKADFANVLEIKGRDRVYFATSKEALLESGSSMNPKNITDTEYWVMTNSNTTRKKMMLHEVALSLGYSADEAEKIRDYL
ncbi:replication initiation negative regulator SeqA [Pseudoalteromonas sp. SSMSWG5]|jgi:negative modulator of initiation of replication|uniref:replication initiation negative regulator SeqA n=1 Tax=Pseudoalteromonas TaxID=53246 RepID=UPI000C64A274|nr:MULTISPECIES: replication initiation negative regulator SeqA [unclassified Pseudoalteromonas]MBD57109.1 replication initiation negative regulator SeqA [Pseudoalteromonas sp.]MBU76638.1 replication initiation negative regulator SeqA [Pseudoalteromonadaceae bacterium]MCF2899561.1 replication initiation negative regulator SeqA [Pseudoalteromonas sp. OFAV1]MCF2921438.1 replication initiation negative regulator SeqA [Pseudoalteromonas sp. APAL1]MCO7249843.1 replication initiation negative regula|tara:strand:+ start:1028 stop:1624 length:597 start_codon:yes stop_codon:yes gene_type:complete